LPLSVILLEICDALIKAWHMSVSDLFIQSYCTIHQLQNSLPRLAHCTPSRMLFQTHPDAYLLHLIIHQRLLVDAATEMIFTSWLQEGPGA